MTVEGFCLTSQSDEPLNEYARCLPHDEITIPPSYGDRNQRWIDGAWSPEIAKKDGYVYKPKFAAFVPTANEQRPRDCVECHRPLPGAVQGPTKQMYCGARCKNKAAWARRVEKRIAS